MKKRAAIECRVIALAVTIICLGWGGFMGMAMAGSQPQPIEGMQYNLGQSMGDNLKSLVGQRVYVHLSTGQTLAGIVKDVGQHLVHIEKLSGKEFYDALIRIETISAVEAQFRKY